MKQSDLLDSKIWTTRDVDEAYRILDELSSSVKVTELRSNEIKLVSYMGESGGKVSFAICDPPDPSSPKRTRNIGMPSGFTEMDKQKFVDSWLGGNEAFYTELKRNGYLLNIGGTLYSCSSETLGTVCSRCNLGGSGLTDKYSVLRDSFITEKLAQRKVKCSVVMRCSDEGMKKVFAVLGGTYTPIPQNAIKDIVTAAEDELLEGEKSEFCGITADNFVTRMYFEFPSIAEEFRKIYGLDTTVMPGLCITTSDVGDSSLTVRGTQRTEEGLPFYVGKVSRIHRGDVDIDKYIDDVRSNIFTEYSKLPVRILELLAIDVYDVKETIKEVMNRSGLAKIIGRKYSEQFAEAASQEFSPAKSYNAFDIADFISKVPGRIMGMSDYAREAFANCTKDVFFVDFEEICGTTMLGLTA